MKNKILSAAGAAAIILAATVGGIPKLEQLEDNKLVTYRDVVDVWTGCSGVTLGMKEGMRFTDAECKQINQNEFQKYAKHVYQETGTSNVPLITAHALFSYNIGMAGYSQSQVLKEYRAGNLQKSCEVMMNWNGLRIKGVKYDCNEPLNQKRVNGCKGIVNRRNEEVKMCLDAIKILPPEPCGFLCAFNH